MTDQKKNLINKDIIIARIVKTISEEPKLVGKIIGQIKNARKKPRARLNINEKQLRIHLAEVIRKWEKAQISSFIDKFLIEVKTSLQQKESILLWGYFSLAVHQMLNKEKNRIRFRASPKLIREINPSSQGKNSYCSKHQDQLKKHKTANCCDKSQGIQAYSRCAKFKKLRNEIKDCANCQNPELFTKQIRK